MPVRRNALAGLLTLALATSGLRAQDIHGALARGDSAAVAALLAGDNSLIGALDAERRTPLHVAAGAGHVGLTALLLARGAALEARDAQDATPLCRAALGGHVAVVALLLDRGADPNASSASLGGAAVDVAFDREVFSDSATVTRMLKDRGAAFDPNGSLRGATRLYLAATQPNLEMLRWLLDLGADPNEGETRGIPALHNAAVRGHVEAVRLLLDRGADVNRPRFDGRTALRLAVGGGHATAVRLLLERGADPLHTDASTGRSLLHTAAILGHMDVVDALLTRGIPPGSRDSAGCTPFCYARRYGHARVASLLTSSGARSSRASGGSARPSLPRGGLRTGSAMAWYLAYRGWAVRTASHLTVFDAEEFYVTRPTEPSLANGFLTAAEARTTDVLALFTVYHGEPGEPGAYVHLLADSVPRIAFVHNAVERWRGPARTTYVRAGQDTTVGGVRVAAIDGALVQMPALAYLADVDGVSIYYQAYGARDTVVLVRGLERLGPRAARVDLAFLPIPRPGESDGHLRLLVSRLRPRVVLLLDPGRRESDFPAVAARVRSWAPGIEVFAAENPGDRYLFRRP